jgi:hypothetical protein
MLYKRSSKQFSCIVPISDIQVVNSIHACGEVDVLHTTHYVIKFVSDLWQVTGFLWLLRFSSTNKTGHHDWIEILLKVALNTND